MSGCVCDCESLRYKRERGDKKMKDQVKKRERKKRKKRVRKKRYRGRGDEEDKPVIKQANKQYL
jgi:hypothetical protein